MAEDAWKEGVVSPKKALQICEEGGCVWLKDYADENYGADDDPHYDYPIEDPDDILTMTEEGVFDGPNAQIILTGPSGSFAEDVASWNGECLGCMRLIELLSDRERFGSMDRRCLTCRVVGDLIPGKEGE